MEQWTSGPDRRQDGLALASSALASPKWWMTLRLYLLSVEPNYFQYFQGKYA